MSYRITVERHEQSCYLDSMIPFVCEVGTLSCFIKMLLFQFGFNIARYTPVAAILYAVLWVWKKRSWSKHQIQGRVSQNIINEISRSGLTLSTWAVLGTLCYTAKQLGWTRAYNDIGQYGLPYLFFSFFLLFFWYETWFYWTHRLIHQKNLFKKMHEAHHRSTFLSPFTTLSFNLAEACIQASYIIIFGLFVPIHPGVIIAQSIFSLTLAIYLHSGYEFFPSRFTEGMLTRWINTPTHHFMHHQFLNHNFSLCLNFWDRICSTNHPQYTSYFENIVKRQTKTSYRLHPIQNVSPEELTQSI